MKKLMFAAAAIAAGVAMADATAITSANVVGYVTTGDKVMPDIMIAASFDNVNASGVLPFNALTCPEGFATFDQIMTSQYDEEEEETSLHTYMYVGDAWYDYEAGDPNPLGDDVGLELGQSAWFLSGDDAKTVTTAGQVHNGSGIHTFTVPDNLCSSFYPVAFCPNNENVSWSDNVSIGDQIMVPVYDSENEETNLRTYMYVDSWYDYEGTGAPLGENDAIVGPGEGFWLLLSDPEATFAEVSPLK